MNWKRYITSMSGTTVRRSPGRKGTPQAEPKPTLPQTAADVLNKHVRLELESIDRMYLNVIVGRLQIVEGALRFIRQQRKAKVLSTNAVEPMTRAFVEAIERFVKHNQIPLVSFEKGQRKDEIAAAMRAQYPHREGVVFVGKAQEKCTVYRTEKRHNPKHNTSYAWIVKSTALVNHYYFYCVDENFGPFFLKFCSYFPYNAKLCLNGHEYAKRQLEREKIAYEALDNRRAVASKAVPVALYWPVGSLIEADSRRLGRGRRIHTRPPMVTSPMRERGIHRAETYNWFRYAKRIGRLTVAAQRRVSCRVDEDVIRVLDLVVRQFALLLFNGADEMAC